MADQTAEQPLVRAAADTVNAEGAASQLSALVDGELAEAEIDLILRRLHRDSALQQRWERYHLISDALQGHLPAAVDADFSVRIRQAIDSEPGLRRAVRPLPAWYKPVTGFALAASVVLVALFGLKLNQTDAMPPTVQWSANPPVAVSPIAQTVLLNDQAGDVSDPAADRLNGYLVNHNGYASRNSVQGMMLPYVRMVGYQSR